ncbi:hypothetical protein CEW46_29260 [Bacillus cereus]|nr:hypothetical protein CEW46_29260 [Bacillus cereus]
MRKELFIDYVLLTHVQLLDIDHIISDLYRSGIDEDYLRNKIISNELDHQEGLFESIIEVVRKLYKLKHTPCRTLVLYKDERMIPYTMMTANLLDRALRNMELADDVDCQVTGTFNMNCDTRRMTITVVKSEKLLEESRNE